jgi:hypothetical protein
MSKNQLFKINPDAAIIQTLVEAFGLTGIDDSRYFTKDNMTESNTIVKILEMSRQLTEYYLPCKSKIYLQNINEKKCITILRQFIKPFHYQCLGKEKSLSGKKHMTYRISVDERQPQVSPLGKDVPHGFVIDFSV